MKWWYLKNKTNLLSHGVFSYVLFFLIQLRQIVTIFSTESGIPTLKLHKLHKCFIILNAGRWHLSWIQSVHFISRHTWLPFLTAADISPCLCVCDSSLSSSCQVFKDEKYLKEAAECAEVIWQRGLLRKGYGICHGTAGNGYAFLSLYKLTQEKKYLYRVSKVTTTICRL